MLSFPLSILFIPYGLFLLIFVFFALTEVYYLARFGASAFTSFVLTFIFLAGMVIVGYWSWYFISPINWPEPITIKLPSFNTIPEL